MIGFGTQVRVFARLRPTDLRLGFAGLAGLVRGELGRDLLAGDWFLFVSKRRHSARVLCWDGSGLCLYSKRLAKGQFVAIWERARGGEVRLTTAELALFLEGSTANSIPPETTRKARKRG